MSDLWTGLSIASAVGAAITGSIAARVPDQPQLTNHVRELVKLFRDSLGATAAGCDLIVAKGADPSWIQEAARNISRANKVTLDGLREKNLTSVLPFELDAVRTRTWLGFTTLLALASAIIQWFAR